MCIVFSVFAERHVHIFFAHCYLYSISQWLVAGFELASLDPAPKFSTSSLVGFSLAANMSNVGAQSTVQPDSPENISTSMHVAKASVCFIPVDVSSPATQATNAVSHS